jgi:hypothetical protein
MNLMVIIHLCFTIDAEIQFVNGHLLYSYLNLMFYNKAREEIRGQLKMLPVLPVLEGTESLWQSLCKRLEDEDIVYIHYVPAVSNFIYIKCASPQRGGCQLAASLQDHGWRSHSDKGDETWWHKTSRSWTCIT